MRSSAPSPQEFIQALRGGGRRGSFGGRAGDIGSSSGSVAGGLLGAVAEANNDTDDKEPESTPTVYFLKYAEAASLADIIHEIYVNVDLRIAIERRLHAIVLQGTPKAIEQIEQLIEALDRQTIDAPKVPAEAPTQHPGR